ncbi:STAS domain-containing protein [Streptomyces sp. DSM 41524]|uniref:STAS domain-containing protein n=1 Tax=Streptomyces asiaticus subsp. ignotus TaxID=3098222 RepID=A0ABU7Q8L9_9ACTN|nr:STAS domain-containing protein [Streptomyces sp. DSM 41524]
MGLPRVKGAHRCTRRSGWTGRPATGPDSCRVAGELDLVTAGEVREALQRAVGENRVVVIDLGGLTFCDCTGLSALLAHCPHSSRR